MAFDLPNIEQYCQANLPGLLLASREPGKINLEYPEFTISIVTKNPGYTFIYYPHGSRHEQRIQLETFADLANSLTWLKTTAKS